MRDQAVTKHGQSQYNIVYPKFKKGGYIVCEVKIGCTYSKYVITRVFVFIVDYIIKTYHFTIIFCRSCQ